MSKCALRLSPRYQAMFTPSMAVSAPRSWRIHWPSPDADQRVARLLSSVFCGTLPSSPLATTGATGRGVIVAEALPWVRVLVVVLQWLRWLVQVSGRRPAAGTYGPVMAGHLESL